MHLYTGKAGRREKEKASPAVAVASIKHAWMQSCIGRADTTASREEKEWEERQMEHQVQMQMQFNQSEASCIMQRGG